MKVTPERTAKARKAAYDLLEAYESLSREPAYSMTPNDCALFCLLHRAFRREDSARALRLLARNHEQTLEDENEVRSV